MKVGFVNMLTKNIKLSFPVLVFIISFLTSCKTAALTMAGVTNPKIEDEVTQQKFLAEEQVDNETAILKFDKLSNIIMFGLSPSSVYVFDSKGANLKLPGSGNKCAPEPFLFIETLDAKKYYPKQGVIHLDSISNWTKSLNEKNAWKTSDFYVVVTWAMWQGKKVFQKDIVSCIEAANKNTSSRIHVLLLNMDKQLSWGEENLKKVKYTKTSIEIMM